MGPDSVVHGIFEVSKQGQQQQGLCFGNLLDSPGQQVKIGFLTSGIGVFVGYS